MTPKQLKARSSLRLKSKTPLQKDEVHKINTILMHLNNHNDSIDFREPVDWKGLQLYDYPEVIRHPMDLGTINNKIREKKYKTVESVLNDIQLIWDNCKMYNSKASEIYDIADKLQLNFRRMVRNYLPNLKIATVTSTPIKPILQPPFIIVLKPERQYDINPEQKVADLQITDLQKGQLLKKMQNVSQDNLLNLILKFKQAPSLSWQQDGQWAKIDIQNIQPSFFRQIQKLMDK